MSSEHLEVRHAYADSITLMQVSQQVSAREQVEAAMVAMATPLNLELLTGMGFPPPVASPHDMLVAVRVTAAEHLDAALASVDAALAASTRPASPAGAFDIAPRTTGSALHHADEVGLVLVSVPGPHAFVEAMDALQAGRDVLIFSDNMALEQEVTLKREAQRRGLLVMGPDCGTAVVGGLGLGFANAVAPGPVGLVAASGTGCQQLLALLDAAGVGISAALGVGGRDLSESVGALSTLQAMRMLDADPATELIVVVSKPPSPAAAAAVAAAAAASGTPVQLALLGPGEPDLGAAAARVLQALGRPVPTWPAWEASGRPVPSWPVWGRPAERDPTVRRAGFLRGLFCGGTLRDEATLVAAAALAGPVRRDIARRDAADSHVMIDFGDDALTAGRAHPMIDPTLRLERLATYAADPATAVLLLDVVLGHGAHPDPAAGLAPAIAAADAPVVVALIGTTRDPQNLQRQAATLVDAGAVVFAANADATRHAISLLGSP